jgi:hypothetical protein
MIERPLVSILMTSYNVENYIGFAIESVLTSTYKNWELIIVDDCSADNTVNIARQYAALNPGIKVFVNEKNLGDYPNRNRAASYATGKYIMYLDADDALYYFGLEVAVEFTERFPEAGFGLGSYPDDDNIFPILVRPREIYLEHFYKYHHFDRAPGSGLIKLEVFNKVGGFSGKRMIGDYEFWFKISRYYSLVKFPIDNYWNRLHSGQESQSSYAKKNYGRLRAEVQREALMHPDCPLSDMDKIQLAAYLRKVRLRENLLSGISRLKGFITFSK